MLHNNKYGFLQNLRTGIRPEVVFFISLIFSKYTFSKRNFVPEFILSVTKLCQIIRNIIVYLEHPEYANGLPHVIVNYFFSIVHEFVLYSVQIEMFLFDFLLQLDNLLLY